MALSTFRAAGDHSTFQRMPQPRTKAAFGGAVIVQVFVERSGNGMLNGSFYRVGGHSRAQPFSKARSASPIIPWVAAQLSHPCTRSHTAQRSLSEGGMLPVLAVRMLVPSLRHCGVGYCQRNGYQNELGDPSHTEISAIGLPFRRR
jgi:hypothetical protein